MKKSEFVWSELKEHLPFSLGASLLAGILVAVLYSFGNVPSEELFELVHPAHVLVSALATSAIYWRYRGSTGGRWQVVGKTILVGVVGAILIGTLSDVLLPWLAGNLFSLHTHLHLPIFEEPILILGVALIGSVIGMYRNFFNVGHSLHIFLSVFASLFYLLAFSVELGTFGIILVSSLVFIAVYVPCCISDIVFPLLFIDKACVKCGKFH